MPGGFETAEHRSKSMEHSHDLARSRELVHSHVLARSRSPVPLRHTGSLHLASPSVPASTGRAASKILAGKIPDKSNRNGFKLASGCRGRCLRGCSSYDSSRDDNNVTPIAYAIFLLVRARRQNAIRIRFRVPNARGKPDPPGKILDVARGGLCGSVKQSAGAVG